MKILLILFICITFVTECITPHGVNNIIGMETTIIRRPTSFRLRADLLDGLRRNAKRENRTLNNYVESILLDIVYREPNDVTKAAIEEAMSGKNKNKVYDSVEELFDDLDTE
jgi:hypothetical protein